MNQARRNHWLRQKQALLFGAALLLFICCVFGGGAAYGDVGDGVLGEGKPVIVAAGPNINAISYILTDATTGKVLYQSNAYQSLPSASTTKIMTAYIVMHELPDYNVTVTAPDDFVNVGESSLHFAAGETYRVIDLLYALMVYSANDAGQLLAIAVSGREEAFAELMNSYSVKLNLTGSRWKNAHGLHAPGHYTTAADLAKLTRLAFEIPLFNQIIATTEYRFTTVDGSRTFNISGHNTFMENYSGADGVKTGYTVASGRCLVGSASRDGARLIGVLLNCNDVTAAMINLMDYGFINFSMRFVVKSGDLVKTVPLKNAIADSIDLVVHEDVSFLMDKLSMYQPEGKFSLPTSLRAPLSTDTKVGTVTYDDGEGHKQTIDLYPAQDVEAYNFWIVMGKILKSIINAWVTL